MKKASTYLAIIAYLGCLICVDEAVSKVGNARNVGSFALQIADAKM